MVDNWHYIFKGIMLCLSIQLLPISFFLLKHSSKRKRILGVFIVLLMLAFSRGIYYQAIEGILVLVSIIRHSLEIFFPPCLYLYIVLADKPKLNVSKHFIFPIIYSIFFILLYTTNIDLYLNNVSSFSIITSNSILFYFVIYLLLGIRFFRKNIDLNLKSRASSKFRIFYYTINVYEIFNIGLVAALANSKYLLPSLHDSLSKILLSQTSIIFMTIMSVLLVLFLIFYIITELSLFREYYLGENIKKHKPFSNNNQKDIAYELERLVVDKKMYLDPGIKINVIALKLNINSNVLLEYFKEDLKMPFNDYINTLRISEFKNRILLVENERYNIIGVAKLCGFNSGATFYRYFKKLEGISPKEYISNIS